MNPRSIFFFTCLLFVSCKSEQSKPTQVGTVEVITTGTETSEETSLEDDGPLFEEIPDAPAVQHGTVSAREALGIHPPEKPWASMSHEEKEMWMVGVVQPISVESFQAHNARRYADFSCETCHGDDAKSKGYEMPSRYLPRLPSTPEAMAAIRARDPVDFDFMVNEVTPTTRDLLGLSAYDPATGQGFGCFGCHTQAR